MEDYSCLEEGTIIIPILQVNKLRLREEQKNKHKNLTQG